MWIPSCVAGFQLVTYFCPFSGSSRIQTGILFDSKIDGNLGDIMSESPDGDISTNCDIQIIWTDGKSPDLVDGLVTCTGKSLQDIFSDPDLKFSALDRIALTANGNLQRIFSSYYNAPIQIIVKKCERRAQDSGQLLPVWDRRVNLIVYEQVFCTATSVITVTSPECVHLIESGEVGIGQLFRYLDRLPTFSLLDAGRTGDGCLWRKYLLSSNELTCMIHEVFSNNTWEIKK